MNEKNIENLKNNMVHLGFGDFLFEELKSEIKKGKSDFKPYFNRHHSTYELYFKEGNKNHMYVFYRYKAQLLEANKKHRSQVFYVNKNRGVTAKEASNLLAGRSVYKKMVGKEGESYNAWLQMDFTDQDKNGNYKVDVYRDNYGYNLEQALHKLPFKRKKDGGPPTWLLKTLKKGNIAEVTLSKEGRSMKQCIAANPKNRNVIMYYDRSRRVKNNTKVPGTFAASEKERFNASSEQDNANQESDTVEQKAPKKSSMIRASMSTASKSPKK
jgi:hypothetical protein